MSIKNGFSKQKKDFVKELKGKNVSMVFPTDMGIQCTIWSLEDFDGTFLKVKAFNGRGALININTIIEMFESTKEEAENAQSTKNIQENKFRGTMFG